MHIHGQQTTPAVLPGCRDHEGRLHLLLALVHHAWPLLQRVKRLQKAPCERAGDQDEDMDAIDDCHLAARPEWTPSEDQLEERILVQRSRRQAYANQAVSAAILARPPRETTATFRAASFAQLVGIRPGATPASKGAAHNAALERQLASETGLFWRGLFLDDAPGRCVQRPTRSDVSVEVTFERTM